MRKIIFITGVFNLLFCSILLSQSINGKLGTSGQFIIRDTAITYLTLSQSTGNTTFFRSIDLPDSNSTSLAGVFTKNGRRFIHNYRAPNTNGMNTFIGVDCGSLTMNGSAVHESSSNTAVGYVSLGTITTGYYNSAFGVASLFSNTTGYGNSAFGWRSLTNNTTGYNNSAYGLGSLVNNTLGIQNSAFGYGSMVTNTTGTTNSAFGMGSLSGNTTGIGNSGFGVSSLVLHTTGSNNTGIGYNGGWNITTGSNNTAIGYSSQVPNNTGNNQVRIGNEFITYAGVQVAWTVTSDKRLKSNITNSNLGLNFISKLNPVSYTRINDESNKSEYGLIAQEVEEVLKELNIDNTGMLVIDDKGMYELRYNDLLAPIIKAIQELRTENDELKYHNEKLSAEVESLKSMSEKLAKLEQLVNDLTTVKNASLTENK